MDRSGQPGGIARRALLRAAAGTGAVLLFPRRSAAEATEIVIDNFTFSPNRLAVKAGATVTWVNRDDMPHSIVCAAIGFHSHALDSDDQISTRFDRPGVFDYICGLHPHMHGTVLVDA
jgi:plastocyanin